jgi:hypothetical protein
MFNLKVRKISGKIFKLRKKRRKERIRIIMELRYGNPTPPPPFPSILTIYIGDGGGVFQYA